MTDEHQKEIDDRCKEITEAIESLCLGSIESCVVEGAIKAYLDSYDDHKD
jgi:hypothetical protein